MGEPDDHTAVTIPAADLAQPDAHNRYEVAVTAGGWLAAEIADIQDPDKVQWRSPEAVARHDVTVTVTVDGARHRVLADWHLVVREVTS